MGAFDTEAQKGPYDLEAQQEQEAQDQRNLDIQIRHGFIRKVYGIVFTQLLVTAGCGAFFTLAEPGKAFLRTLPGFISLFVALVVAMILCFILVCFSKISKKFPLNYILLGIFTLCESFFVGGICGIVSIRFGSHIVLMAVTSTAVLVLGLTLFALQCKYEFVSWAGALTIALIVMMAFGIMVALSGGGSGILGAVIAAVMILIFSIYLIIDTQLILGRGKVKIDEDEYILAALSLYMDIINIFLYMLHLLSYIAGSSGG